HDILLTMDKYLSTINSYPVSYAVYSSLSFFGPHTGGELPGRWFVGALGRVEGRQRFYRFTPLARAEARLGLARIMDPLPRGWDGQWTIVHLRFSSRE